MERKGMEDRMKDCRKAIEGAVEAAATQHPEEQEVALQALVEAVKALPDQEAVVQFLYETALRRLLDTTWPRRWYLRGEPRPKRPPPRSKVPYDLPRTPSLLCGNWHGALGQAHGRQYAEEHLDDVAFFKRLQGYKRKPKSLELALASPESNPLGVDWSKTDVQSVSLARNDDLCKSLTYLRAFIAAALEVWEKATPTELRQRSATPGSAGGSPAGRTKRRRTGN
jgi:hypothetical protein